MTESERLIDRLFIAARRAKQNGSESRLLRVAGSLLKLLDEAEIQLAERDGENRELNAEIADWQEWRSQFPTGKPSEMLKYQHVYDYADECYHMLTQGPTSHSNLQIDLVEAKAKLDALEAENATLREEIRMIRLNDGPMKNLSELEKDKARLDWIDRERDERSRASITSQLDHHLVQGWKVREAIDATAGYWEPEFINWYEETSSNA